jgi:hypothetical protein
VATFILKRDNLKLGLLLGLIGPILGLIVVYFVKFSSISFLEFFDLFIHENKLITSLGTICLLANAVIFTFYINTHRDQTAKGIFVTTLIYGIGILMLKIFNP